MLVKKWEIRLLGKLEAQNGSTIVRRFSTKHIAILLAYLARRLDQKVTRDQLVDLLWPEADLVTGRRRLRVALASLRSHLEPVGTPPGTVLEADRDAVSLRADACDVDVSQFRAQVTAGLSTASPSQSIERLRRADALYRGPFCAGLDHEWIEMEREALLASYVSAEIALSQQLQIVDDPAEAAVHARQAVAADPLSEPARKELLKVLMSQGLRDAANLEFDDFKRVLRTEVGLEPTVEMAKLLIPTGATQRSAAEVQEPAKHSPDRLPRHFEPYVEPPSLFESLRELVLASRIVTLSGPVGIGKSRLAIEFARHYTSLEQASTWFVSAEEDGDRRLIELLLEEMGAAPSATEDPFSALEAIVRRDSHSRSALIVVDDADKLPGRPKLEIREILSRMPWVTFLLTARSKLGMAGEQEHAVAPLPLPDPTPATLSDLTSNLCVQLFLSRARAVQPDLHLNPSNAHEIARICAALDGIPLAIELAASQVRKSRLTTLVQELSRPRKTSSWRDPRHRTLEAAFRVNRLGLPPEDADHLATLTVFHGSWDVEAAAAVLPGQDVEAILERLVSQALIVAEPMGAGTRYRMLGSISRFASFDAAPEVIQTAVKRHARHFLRFALTFSATVGQAGFNFHKVPVYDRDNLRAALRAFLDDPDATREVAQMVSAMAWFWVLTAAFQEGLGWVNSVRSRIGNLDGILDTRLALCEATLAAYADDPSRALAVLREREKDIEALHDPWILGFSRWTVGFSAYLSGEYATAEAKLREALDTFQGIGADWWSACCRHLLGFALLAQDRAPQSRAEFERSIDEWQQCGDRYTFLSSQMGLARVSWAEGDYEAAREQYVACFEVFRMGFDMRHIMYCLEGLARVACSSGNWVKSAHLLGVADRCREDHGLKLDFADSMLHKRTVETVQRELGDRFASEWTLGRGVTWSSYLTS